MADVPRMYSLVTFEPYGPWELYPFKQDTIFVFLGEIPDMEGHCIVIEKGSSEVHVGYHTENFHEIPKNDL